MSQMSPIERFQGVVDVVLQSQIDDCNKRKVSWPDRDRIVRHGLITYERFEADGPKPWHMIASEVGGRAITASNQHVNRYGGSLTLISPEDDTEKLIREWTFGETLALSIHTAKEITKPDQLEMAADWAASPHMYPLKLVELGRLTGEERMFVADMFAKKALRDAAYQNSITELRRRR